MNEFAQSAKSDRFAVARPGVYLFGLATMVAGILDLIWGDFDIGHQPIEALGVYIPGRAIFAYITGMWLILAGSAIFWRRTVRFGAWAMAIIYFIFGMFSLPRFYTMPHRFGFHVTLILGVFGEMLQQFIVVAGCVVLCASFAPPSSRWTEKAPLVARVTFGLSGVLFGLAHLTNAKGIVHMIPKWMPFGAPFWILISGIGFMLAGLAILSGILNVLAARLLVLMLLIFEVALVPIIFGYPHVHEAWGASAYNLTVAGAVWIFAASLPRRHAQRERAIQSVSELA
jgi:uncharacterized membrane protein